MIQGENVPFRWFKSLMMHKIRIDRLWLKGFPQSVTLTDSVTMFQKRDCLSQIVVRRLLCIFPFSWFMFIIYATKSKPSSKYKSVAISGHNLWNENLEIKNSLLNFAHCTSSSTSPLARNKNNKCFYQNRPLLQRMFSCITNMRLKSGPIIYIFVQPYHILMDFAYLYNLAWNHFNSNHYDDHCPSFLRGIIILINKIQLCCVVPLSRWLWSSDSRDAGSVWAILFLVYRLTGLTVWTKIARGPVVAPGTSLTVWQCDSLYITSSQGQHCTAGWADRTPASPRTSVGPTWWPSWNPSGPHSARWESWASWVSSGSPWEWRSGNFSS